MAFPFGGGALVPHGGQQLVGAGGDGIGNSIIPAVSDKTPSGNNLKKEIAGSTKDVLTPGSNHETLRSQG